MRKIMLSILAVIVSMPSSTFAFENRYYEYDKFWGEGYIYHIHCIKDKECTWSEVEIIEDRGKCLLSPETKKMTVDGFSFSGLKDGIYTIKVDIPEFKRKNKYSILSGFPPKVSKYELSKYEIKYYTHDGKFWYKHKSMPVGKYLKGFNCKEIDVISDFRMYTEKNRIKDEKEARVLKKFPKCKGKYGRELKKCAKKYLKKN